MLAVEDAEGLNGLEYYADFTERVKSLKRDLLTYLIDVKQRGKVVVSALLARRTRSSISVGSEPTSSITRSIGTRTSKETFSPAPGSRSSIPAGSARLVPTTCSLVRGTSLMRSSNRRRSYVNGADGGFANPDPEGSELTGIERVPFWLKVSRLDVAGVLGVDEIGDTLHDLVERLYPICRSITGDDIYEKHWQSSTGLFRSKSTKSRPELKYSTGLSTASGTSVQRGSTIRAAKSWLISPTRICMSWATACQSTLGCHWTSSARISTACRIGRT